jgi:hypothetical protein
LSSLTALAGLEAKAVGSAAPGKKIGKKSGSKTGMKKPGRANGIAA